MDERVDRGSRVWRLAFIALYRVIRILDPLIRWLWPRSEPWFTRFVDVHVVGRRTGRDRRLLLTMLTVGDRSYVGHPNGPAAWTTNLEAAGSATILRVDGSREVVDIVRLPVGPEREAVIRATWSQQPFPADFIYSAARDHVRRCGVYYRLEPRPGP